MSMHVLYYTESADDSEGWQQRLALHGYDTWRTSEADQLVLLARSRPVVGVLLETSLREASLEPLAGLIRRLREEPSLEPAPIIALFDGVDALPHAAELAEAGLTGFHLRGMPESLLLHHLAGGRSMQSLRALESSGMSVERLAGETRQKIHDLSQPLAALQGRLQILQSRTPPDDPQKDKIDLMVKLTMEIGLQLRELQELHRKFS